MCLKCDVLRGDANDKEGAKRLQHGWIAAFQDTKERRITRRIKK